MVAGDIEFSNELQSYIDEWSKKEGGLVMMLHRIQNEFGYVPRAAAEKLSLISGIPLAKIYGVITFYHFFKTTKPGKHRIAVCLGTACYLKGGQDLLEETCSILSIEPDEMTDDGLFSVDEVRCLGCCGLAPVLMIDNEVYGKLTKEQLPGIIAKYRSLLTRCIVPSVILCSTSCRTLWKPVRISSRSRLTRRRMACMRSLRMMGAA